MQQMYDSRYHIDGWLHSLKTSTDEICTLIQYMLQRHRGGVAQLVARLTRDQWIPVSREFESHQRPHCCFLEQETLLSLLNTGWFQEGIRA